MADKPVKRPKSERSPERDANGQFEKQHPGGTNDGVASADPRVLSGKEDGDATFPIKKKK